MATRAERTRMSVEEYLELDRNSSDVKYEYGDGYAYMMSGGIPQHALIIGNFQRELSRQLEQRGSSCLAYPSDVTVWLSEAHYVHPDVVVTCDEHDLVATDSLRAPQLVVEALSPGTEKRDRSEKFDWYRSCPSIQEIVFVRTEHPLVELYRRQSSSGKWLLQFYGPGDVVELISLDMIIPTDVIYRRVLFPEG